MEEKLYKNKDWMHEHYIVLQESTVLMAQKADCGQSTIRLWLRKFNIPTRSIFEAKRNHLSITQELLDLLGGELLGDGCITMNGSRSALYQHDSKYKEYLVWLSKTFADLGLEQVGKINKRWSKKGNAFGYHYQSRSYPELVLIRQQWYPGGEKIVPKDLRLNPIIARQWHIGDGCLHNRAGHRPYIYFSTCDFDKASIDHLLEEFRDKGFIVTHRPSCNSIGMSVKSVKDFLDWIGPCPISCYSYKWDYQDNRKSMNRGESYEKLA